VFSQIKTSVDLFQHASKYVELRGTRPAKGCCIFHKEKTPSLCVYDDGHFFCYGCQVHGSVIDFEAARTGLSILDAARSLCQEYGITVSQEEQERFSASQELRGRKAAIADALAHSRGERPAIIDYLRKERGFSDQTIADFGIGVGLKENVFIIPIKDRGGKVVAFAVRHLDYKERSLPKWRNDAADAIYEKRKILFNFDRARREVTSYPKLILCESYADVIALHEAGIKTGMAYCSANVTPEQCAELKTLAGNGVTLLFAACSDTTAQGKLLVNRTMIRSVAPELHIRAIVIPDFCKDLNDVLVASGAAGLQKIVAESVSMDQYLLDRVLDDEPVVDLQYRRAKEIVSIAENALSQNDMIAQLAKRWSKEVRVVEQYVLGKGAVDAAAVQFDSVESLLKRYEVHVRDIEKDVVKFGWSRYNQLTRGMHRGDVIQLVAPSGVGKTTWVESLMLSVGQTQPYVPQVFFSLEQASIFAFERFMQMRGSLESREVEKWMRPGEDAHNSKIFNTAQGPLSDLKSLLVCEAADLTLAQIEAHVRQAGFSYFGAPVRMVYIDYLGFLKGNGKSSYEVVSEIAREQKAMAKRLGCTVVSLHQVTKEFGAGDEVGEKSARDSSAVRDSADVLITAWRPEMKESIPVGEKERLRGVWRSKIAKNRYGPANEIIDLEFVPQFFQLKESNGNAAIAAAIANPVGGFPPVPFAPGFGGQDKASGGTVQ